MALETTDPAPSTAPAEALPPLLADPPWRRRRGSGPPAVLELTAPGTASMVWAPGEREEWLSAPFEVVGEGDGAATADRLRRGEQVAAQEAAEFFAAGPEELARPLLAGWRPENTPDWRSWMRRVIARFETDALRPVLGMSSDNRVTAEGLLLPFRAPALVPRMAVHRQWPLDTAAVGAWFERHTEFAAVHLVPLAFSSGPRFPQAGKRALLHLAGTGHVDTVRAAGEFYGPQAAAAVELLLAAGPPGVLPAKLPPIPKWFDPAALPPVRLRRPAPGPPLVLPATVLRDVAMVFALHDPQEPYPGVDVLREACEPSDLARFAWALFEQWVAAGGSGRQGWALDALGLVGDDEVVRRLTPQIMVWPGQSAHARALSGLSVLEEIGTEVALLHVHHIAEKSRFEGLRSAAQDRLGRLAGKRGLTAEQLADRLVPDLGLGADGGLILDYGSRRFTVRFDEQLQPCVADDGGKLLRSLPRPGARDDAELAPAAYRRFAELKKDVRTVAAGQISRLERAMVTGRRWPEEELRRFFTGHPLLRHPARRLLWARYDAKDVQIGAFRVAEDGTFADVHDEVVTIAEDEVVGLAHPIHLGESRPQWSEVFADYAILQPFPQLGRETATMTEAEAAGPVLTRFEGRQVPSGAVLGLLRRGWVRNAMSDHRTLHSVSPNLMDSLELEVHPGIVLGAVDLFPEQTLGPVRLGRRAATFGDLDPVAFSELIRDLESLTNGR